MNLTNKWSAELIDRCNGQLLIDGVTRWLILVWQMRTGGRWSGVRGELPTGLDRSLAPGTTTRSRPGRLFASLYYNTVSKWRRIFNWADTNKKVLLRAFSILLCNLTNFQLNWTFSASLHVAANVVLLLQLYNIELLNTLASETLNVKSNNVTIVDLI